MDLVLLVYLAGMLESIRMFLTGAFIVLISIIVFVPSAIIIFTEDLGLLLGKPMYSHDEQFTSAIAIAVALVKKAIVVTIVLAITACFLPAKEVLIAYAGLKVSNAAIHSELGKKSIKLIEAKLDDMLLDIKNKKEETKNGN